MMGLRILGGDEQAAMFCSTSMTAFGPVFMPNEAHLLDALEVAELFTLLHPDCRSWDTGQVDTAYAELREWLDKCPVDFGDVDDFVRLHGGEMKCLQCAEWFTPDVAKGAKTPDTCPDCERENARDEAADAAYDGGIDQ
jgi:hypothetical protein